MVKKAIKENWKQALMSIFVGAAVTFVVSMLQGIAHILQSFIPDIVGASVATIHYAAKSIKIR